MACNRDIFTLLYFFTSVDIDPELRSQGTCGGLNSEIDLQSVFSNLVDLFV
jgi:hypothetical protein